MSEIDYSAELPNILANMIDVYYRTDIDGRILIVTPSVKELLGYTPAELQGVYVADLYEAPEQRDTLMQRMDAEGGQLMGEMTRLRHKDGHLLWVSANICYYHGDDGQVAGVEGVVRDVTQQLETEQSLRKSEQKFRAIIDHLLDIYYRTDAEGRLIMASPSCKELLGYTPEELLGTRLSDLYVDPSTRDTFMRKLIEQGGKYYGFENNLRRKDGSEIWAVASSQYYFDDAGNIAGVEGIVRDITRRKQMEDALRESEHKLRTIFENMMDTYVRTDRDGTVVMVSPSVEKLLGYTIDEMIGRPLREFYAIPESRNTFLRLLDENGGHYYGYEVLMSHKDGQPIWVLINAQFYYDEDGRVAGVEALGRNISELKEAEVQLLQAKENAEAANRAKTEFLSNMSHELRTPLNAILGFSSLLINYSQQPLPDKVNDFLDNIHEAGLHLSSLIDQVLDLAKIEAGRANLDLQSVALGKMLDDCLRLIRPLAIQHRIKLNFEAENCQNNREQDVFVSADVLRLRQVMINLISNAIKYNGENGQIWVRCRPSGDNMLVEVEDNGIGIPREQQEDIFMPFTRVHHGHDVEGSGIGLAVTQKNLELMGSRIYLESKPGKGSRFWFELPRVAPPAVASQPSRAQVELPQVPLGISVLYVEDNPIGMRLMEEVIHTLPGVRFYGADSGEEGFRLAREVQPDLIFMDINLPDISGIEVMQRLRSEERTSSIPVIALSASALDEDVRRGLEAGFLHYLRKPSEPEEIIRLVTGLAHAEPFRQSRTR